MAATPTSHKVPYLQLDAEIEACIRSDKATGKRHPLAFCDENIVRREEKAHDAATLTRPAFARDIEKILHVPAYNRYADKTQVFSLAENDEICRRGLHVQLVSRIARNIGDLLGLNTELIEAIALGHDVGHTPFGHAGEHFLSASYHQHTDRYFNHNVQSVRVLDKLYRRNISLQTLDGVLCHNGEFCQQEFLMGTMSTFAELDATVEACTAEQANIKHLRPSTLEGCVVRISDMIAYMGKDRADAYDMGLLDSFSVFETNVIGRTNAQIINNLTVDIVNNSYGKDRICLSREAYEDLKIAKRQNNELIYLKEGFAGDTGNVVEIMFGQMYEKLLDDLVEGREASPIYRHHITRLAAKSTSITRESYINEEPNQIVVDYISSMTDSYFLAIYQHLFPESSLSLQFRSYCADLA